MRQPGLVFRSAVLLAQGVVFNAFFAAYILSPKTCHRFVGYLEEEAVKTYTRALADLDAGLLPAWESQLAPPLAVEGRVIERPIDSCSLSICQPLPA